MIWVVYKCVYNRLNLSYINSSTASNNLLHFSEENGCPGSADSIAGMPVCRQSSFNKCSILNLFAYVLFEMHEDTRI